jgi:signal transduction histidine kinase
MKIKYRMLISILSMVFVTSAAISFIYIFRTEDFMMSEFENKIRSLSSNLAHNAVYGVMIENKEILSGLIKNLLREKEIVRAAITSKDGKILAQTGTDSQKQSRILKVPVLLDHRSEKEISDDFSIMKEDLNGEKNNKIEEIGTVTVDYSLDEIRNSISDMRFFSILTTILLFLVGSVMALFLAHLLSAPISRVLHAIQGVASGDLERRVDVSSKDEIGQLGESFNRMIESLVKSREELKTTLSELARKERLASMGKFVSIIAHEIKNPLGIILSSAQVIKNPARNEEMRLKAAEYIEEEVKRLDNTITHFLRFSRPPEPKLSRSNLSEIVKSTLSKWHRDEAIQVIFDSDSENFPVMCDPDLIHQVLLNILINASHSMEGKGEITVSIEQRENYAEVKISDTGDGIPDDIIGKIFDPFFTTKKQGMGLGLAIAHQVMEGHNGSISAANNTDEGATFILRFPLKM